MIKLLNSWIILNWNCIGKKPLCNKRFDRSPHIGTYCFILCWRCSSIAIGSASSLLLYKSVASNLAVLLIIPTFIDGVLQYKYKIESTNIRRIVTGLLAGFGIGYIITNIKSAM